MGYITRILQAKEPAWVEGFGTFILVLIATSAVTAIGVAGQATSASTMLLGAVASSLTFGWLVAVFGDRSLGYFNPAITIMRWVRTQLSFGQMLIVLVAELGGGLAASVVVALLYGTPGVQARLGAPYPSTDMGTVAALVAEVLGTVVLLLAIDRADQLSETNRLNRGLIAALGLTLGMLLAGGVSGAALNPVRALAPQLVAADTRGWWAYVIGPLMAAGLVGFATRTASVESDQLALKPRSQESAPSSRVSADEEQALLRKKAQQAAEALKRQQPKEPAREPVQTDEPAPSHQVTQPSFEDEPETGTDEVIDSQPEPESTHPVEAGATPRPSSPVRFIDFERDEGEES